MDGLRPEEVVFFCIWLTLKQTPKQASNNNRKIRQTRQKLFTERKQSENGTYECPHRSRKNPSGKKAPCTFLVPRYKPLGFKRRPQTKTFNKMFGMFRWFCNHRGSPSLLKPSQHVYAVLIFEILFRLYSVCVLLCLAP